MLLSEKSIKQCYADFSKSASTLGYLIQVGDEITVLGGKFLMNKSINGRDGIYWEENLQKFMILARCK